MLLHKHIQHFCHLFFITGATIFRGLYIEVSASIRSPFYPIAASENFITDFSLLLDVVCTVLKSTRDWAQHNGGSHRDVSFLWLKTAWAGSWGSDTQLDSHRRSIVCLILPLPVVKALQWAYHQWNCELDCF